MAQGRALLVGLALLVLAVVSAGCLSVDDPVGDALREEDASASASAAASEEDPRPPDHTLTLLAWDEAKLSEVLSVEDVTVSPKPSPLSSFQIGPDSGEAATVLARFNVTEGYTLDPFTLHVTVDDGLGPAELTIEVPAWRPTEDARVNVYLAMDEVGEAEIDRVDGDLAVEVAHPEGQPRYGYLEWPTGARQPLDGLDTIVSVPQAFPRFGPGAEPSFATEDPVVWRLDGERVAEGTELALQPRPGRHTLVLADPEGEAEAEVTFSLNHRLAIQDAIVAGSGPHREPVAGANADTHNLTIHEGVSSVTVRLEPVGRPTDAENLDLYALNASGGVIGQSATNGTTEHMRLSNSDLDGLDHVRLRVHGQVALDTEYRLTANTFYRPW